MTSYESCAGTMLNKEELSVIPYTTSFEEGWTAVVAAVVVVEKKLRSCTQMEGERSQRNICGIL